MRIWKPRSLHDTGGSSGKLQEKKKRLRKFKCPVTSSSGTSEAYLILSIHPACCLYSYCSTEEFSITSECLQGTPDSPTTAAPGLPFQPFLLPPVSSYPVGKSMQSWPLHFNSCLLCSLDTSSISGRTPPPPSTSTQSKGIS